MEFKLCIDPSGDEELVLHIRSDGDFVDRVRELITSYNGSDKITAFSNDEITFLNFDEIECVTVLDRKTFAITKDGKRYRITHTLSALEALLPDNFIRINKSCIANKKQIKCFKTLFSGAVDAVFKSGYKDYVSRRCFADIKRRFKNDW